MVGEEVGLGEGAMVGEEVGLGEGVMVGEEVGGMSSSPSTKAA